MTPAVGGAALAVVLAVSKSFLYYDPMTTRHRFRNKYRLQIREKDHLPMHCHLVGGNIDVAIDLQTLTVIEGRWPADLAEEVLDWLTEHQHELIAEWHKWHP